MLLRSLGLRMWLSYCQEFSLLYMHSIVYNRISNVFEVWNLIRFNNVFILKRLIDFNWNNLKDSTHVILKTIHTISINPSLNILWFLIFIFGVSNLFDFPMSIGLIYCFYIFYQLHFDCSLFTFVRVELPNPPLPALPAYPCFVVLLCICEANAKVKWSGVSHFFSRCFVIVLLVCR